MLSHSATLVAIQMLQLLTKKKFKVPAIPTSKAHKRGECSVHQTEHDWLGCRECLGSTQDGLMHRSLLLHMETPQIVYHT